jgi:hypothetical protein
MKLIDLPMDRLVIHQHVYANEVYLPMEGGCQDPVYNTWQILTMRKLFMKKLKISDQINYNIKPVMMLMKRSSSSKHTRNGHDSVRQWSQDFTNRIIEALKIKFPKYNIILFRYLLFSI